MAIGFAAAILLGALLLWLPISSAPGEETSFVDALFTATTSICVTGLVTVPTFSNFSTFGHGVILVLIQLGGLGVITCSMLAFVLLGRKITIKNRKLIQESYNLDSMSGMVRIIKKVVLGTMVVEGIGTILFSFSFIPRFGLAKGIWVSLFNSVSAFCNAGIDILGPDSLRTYISDPLVNFTTMGLIIAGGIGFLVWWDVGKNIRNVVTKKIHRHQFWQKLQLHTKLVLFVTLLLIFVGAALIMAFEYKNPNTMENMSLGEKIMASLFQSVTTRTAGFETIEQAKLTDSSSIISMILMFIGGSPMGTAGGLKTTTIAVLVLTAIAYFRGKKKTDVFNRQITENNTRTAIVVVLSGVFFLFLNIILLSAVTGGSFMDVSYEVTSALATVGLSRGFTPSLPVIGKILVIISMYIGRLGPITLASAVTIRSREANTSVERPEKRIMIG